MRTTNPAVTASLHVLALVNAGVTPVNALRLVCGAERTDAMIASVYHELHNKPTGPFTVKRVGSHHWAVESETPSDQYQPVYRTKREAQKVADERNAYARKGVR